MQSSVVTILMLLFLLLQHYLLASSSYHHIISQFTENRKENYSNVAKVAVAFEISIRFLQRRVRESESRFDRLIINEAFNEIQEKTLFQYIEHLDRIEMSSIAEMIQNNINYFLKLNDVRKD